MSDMNGTQILLHCVLLLSLLRSDVAHVALQAERSSRTEEKHFFSGASGVDRGKTPAGAGGH